MSEARTVYLEGLFPKYVALGPARTIAQVAKTSNVPVLELAKHASAHNWIQRASEVQQAAVDRAGISLADQLVEMNQTHLTALRVLRERAMTALNGGNVNFEKIGDVVRALDLAVQLERRIIGADERGVDDRQREELMKRVAAREIPNAKIGIDIGETQEFTFNPAMVIPPPPDAVKTGDSHIIPVSQLSTVIEPGRIVRIPQVALDAESDE